MTDYPDGGFERQKKPGRPGKKVRFNPDRNFLNMAIIEFLKNGGKITRCEPAGDDVNRVYLSPNLTEQQIMSTVYLL